eukprot:10151694-Alexandrium_andersonii.AAC.1
MDDDAGATEAEQQPQAHEQAPPTDLDMSDSDDDGMVEALAKELARDVDECGDGDDAARKESEEDLGESLLRKRLSLIHI